MRPALEVAPQRMDGFGFAGAHPGAVAGHGDGPDDMAADANTRRQAGVIGNDAEPLQGGLYAA